jgi:cytochrome c oxidase subunit IV
MNGTSPSPANLWRGPLLAWAVLVVLAAINLGSAYVPLGAGNVALNLLIAAVMAVVLAVFLMDLQNAKTLIRVVSVTGLFWMIFMFALTFSDYLSRA